MLRSLARQILRSQPISDEERVYTFLRDRGFAPQGIIDVGAYEGKWSESVRAIFGELPTLMVEAQEQKAPFLEDSVSGHDDWSYKIALLAAETGREVSFYEMETGSSMMSENSDVRRKESKLRTTTLDEIAADLPGDELFLKIDVQGAELEVLKGATETLRRAGLVQLETAFLTYNEGAPTMCEVLTFMEQRGFLPVDIAGQIRIKRMLIQIDLLFTPRGNPLRPEFFAWEADSTA